MTPVRAVAAVVRRGGRLLLVRQQGPDYPSPNWALPGGRILPDEPVFAALYREVREETGLRLTRIGDLLWAVEVRSEYGPDSVALIYEGEVAPGEPVPEDPDEYILDARFVEVEEAVALIEKTLPWRSMAEPLVAYLRGSAEPGTNWFYRAESDILEVLELVLPPRVD